MTLSWALLYQHEHLPVNQAACAPTFVRLHVKVWPSFFTIRTQLGHFLLVCAPKNEDNVLAANTVNPNFILAKITELSW